MTKKELELKVDELQKIISEKNEKLEQAYQKNNELLASADEKFMESPLYKQLMRDLEITTEIKKTAERRLELSMEREEKLRNRLKELEETTFAPKHNERNAGRKKADDKWVESFNNFVRLYESQKSKDEIMEKMKISRATYFRYKKIYDDTTSEGITN